MSFVKYLKEKWMTYIFIIICFVFSFAVYILDNHFTVSESNARYILFGLILFLIIFIALDYSIWHARIKKMNLFCSLNTSSEEDLDVFTYPMDRAYAEDLQNVVRKYEAYKAEIDGQLSEEIEFITKWIHDVKVPIASLRLIIESHDHNLKEGYYERVDTEIAAIEQSIQTVFYHIKSNDFYNDYTISEIDTKKIIGDALKKFASFFSYKKINIFISNSNFKVLTDEKWSEYVISQIISNAVKHTPVNGNITINTYKKENQTTITIKNTGKGILSKDIGQIFNKGYTSSKDRSGMKATGYGLYLSKKLCDRMAHQLTVHSEYGEYAQFELTFIDQPSFYK